MRKRAFSLVLILAMGAGAYAQNSDGDPDLAEAQRALASWRAAATPAEKLDLAESAVSAAVHAGMPEAVVEIATGGVYPGAKIAIPTPARTVRLTPITTLPPEEPNKFDGTFPWVIRRITATTFEAWQPHVGFLFDAKGHILNKARPPRRDGVGREWYGAFLPDGRWVTTDLWDYDRTLTLFSAKGKYRLEIPSEDLIPKTDEDWGTELIGWARADAAGKGWIVSVGSEGGRGLAYVSADGSHRPLAKDENPFAMCYPRDLEPKGFYRSLHTSSDDGKVVFGREEAGHGIWVGSPSFSWTPDNINVVIPDGGNAFGFLPDSHRVFIEREIDSEGSGPPTYETWFFDESRKFLGWIAARPFGDAAQKQSLLFLDENGDVVTVDPDHKTTASWHFVTPDGKSVVPEKIFADLSLGFFREGDRIILARWKGAP